MVTAPFRQRLKADSMFILSGFDVVPCNQNFGLSDSLLTIRFRRQDTTCEDQSKISSAFQCRRSFKSSSRSKEEASTMFPEKN
ncbi:hypothetical protein Bca4012_083802 [Brassica carinata]|uniref:Uncharacterized protein n=1 Tax=Brassica carinata TaxID=52824 RepID=A0A8X7SLD5_BRACI|nr:hypothetical protein Bca52824_026942 [Brassica carinata]